MHTKKSSVIYRYKPGTVAFVQSVPADVLPRYSYGWCLQQMVEIYLSLTQPFSLVFLTQYQFQIFTFCFCIFWLVFILKRRFFVHESETKVMYFHKVKIKTLKLHLIEMVLEDNKSLELYLTE